MTHPVEEIANAIGGKIDEVGRLPDGSGWATVSSPLPKTHWLYEDKGFNRPPMPWRMGTDHPLYREYHNKMSEVAKYAIRCATMNGKEDDFDPDAMVQNFLVGAFGYHTSDGLTDDTWANPDPIPPEYPR